MASAILILEDHQAMRDALVQHVQGFAAGAEVAGVASPADVPATAAFDLALVDLDLGEGVDFLAAVRLLVKTTTTVIVMSAAAPAATVQEAIREGAWTYVPKTSSLAELDAALTAWSRDDPFLGGELAGKLATPQISGVALAEGQRRALALYSTGMSHRAISQTMGVTTQAVSDLLASSLAAYRR